MFLYMITNNNCYWNLKQGLEINLRLVSVHSSPRKRCIIFLMKTCLISLEVDWKLSFLFWNGYLLCFQLFVQNLRLSGISPSFARHLILFLWEEVVMNMSSLRAGIKRWPQWIIILLPYKNQSTPLNLVHCTVLAVHPGTSSTHT